MGVARGRAALSPDEGQGAAPGQGRRLEWGEGGWAGGLQPPIKFDKIFKILKIFKIQLGGQNKF